MKRKNEKQSTFLETLDKAVLSLGTVVDERWWVEEIKPGKENWYDGWSTGYSDQVVDRSGYFKTREEAESFRGQMQTEFATNRLEIRHQKCYERLERRWL